MNSSTTVLERFAAVVDELYAMSLWQMPGAEVADLLERAI
jgi:hypothetical protein